MGWRDALSEGAQADVEDLLDGLLPFAQEMLDKHGEFYPFGAAVSADGALSMLAADAGGEQRPKSPVLLDVLYGGARSRADRTRAAAFVSDARLRQDGSPFGDAIRVEIEHREGLALVFALPYRTIDGQIDYGAMFGEPGEARIWIRAG